MEIKSCKRCGALFQYVTGKVVCPKCKEKEEELFMQVKDYLRENPGAIIKEVSEATGAPIPMIEGFLRDGRLEVAEGSVITLLCERCGKKIKSGRYCQVCTKEVAHEVAGTVRSMRPEPEGKERTPDRMRFLDSKKIKK